MAMRNKKSNRDYTLTKKIKEQSVAVIFFVVVAAVIINSILIYTRIDLTRNNIYSISDASKEILQDIENTVYVDYYISSTLKLSNDQPQQIIDLLQEYSARSRNKVVFIEKDATKEEFRQELELYGIEAKQIQIVEKEQASFSIVYSGIVVSYQDRYKVMPFAFDSAMIEYQITSKILEVYSDDDRELGVLILDPTLQFEQNFGELNQILSADFKIEVLERGQPIEDNIDSLFVLGAGLADNDTLYYIDQFLMTGKGIYFAVDPASVNLQTGIQIYEQNSELLALLEHYGVAVEPLIVADELHNFIPLNQGGFQVIQPYALWVTIGEENVNFEHPITTNFGGFDLYWTSPLTATGDTENFIPLFSSSEKAWTISSSPLQQNVPPQEAAELTDTELPLVFEANPDPTNFLALRNNSNEKQYVLTAAVLGPLTSGVDAGLITKPEDAEEYVREVPQGRFVITGSTVFATNIFRATNAFYNLTFLSNASEWLSNNNKLLQIKSRLVRNTQLNKIQGETKKETLMLIVKLLNMALIPLLIIVVGIIVIVFRKNISRKQY